MPTIPYADVTNTDNDLRRYIQTLPRVSSIVRMLANANTLVEPVMTLIMSIVKTLDLSPKCRELIILNVAALENGRYEWEQHTTLGAVVGITDAQIEQISKRAIQADSFEPAERCLLQFSEDLVHQTAASPTTLEAMKGHFTSREIVEAIVVVGAYMMLARVTETTDVDIEPALDPEAVAKMLKR